MSTPLSSQLASAMSAAAVSVSPSTKLAQSVASSTAAVTSRQDASSTAVVNAALLLIEILRFLSGVLIWLAAFVSITLPTWLFTFFSTGLTITMNATTVILVVLAFVSTVSWFVRYRFLNVYARLPPQPQRKEPEVELFPDVGEGDSKRGLSNYLDEFFSAIKVFGYLERPVFHELTRTMQTKKLIAGETLLLEEEQGFCLVVDGLMQIFVKASRNGAHSEHVDSTNLNDEEDDMPHRNRQGYQLLTEVKNGAPLSSLFSILSLFTEDVKLRYDDSDDTDSRPPTSHEATQRGSMATAISGHGTPSSNPGSPISPGRTKRTHVRGSASLNVPGEHHPTIPPLSLDSDERSGDAPQKHTDYGRSTKRSRAESVHPDIVARATEDTTIAIIPASAFRRLTRTYPRASSHIVQVILTRLQRVTLRTSHAYFGLTSEVLRTEKLMNKFTTYDLPSFLHGSALDRLKENFAKERVKVNAEEGSKGVALHNPRAQARRRSSTALRREAAIHARVAASREQGARGAHSAASNQSPAVIDDNDDENDTRDESNRSNVNAGDLLTRSYDPARKLRKEREPYSQPFQITTEGPFSGDARPSDAHATSGRNSFARHRTESQDEVGFFRDAIVECMLKAIGLTNSKGIVQPTQSVEQSPKLVAYDTKRQRAMFSSAFGLVDALDGDGDSESIMSTAASTTSVPGAMNMQDELSNDVEIVYFPQGSVLVEQGERNPGLYYVIDGFLDVSVPMDETAPSSSRTDFSSISESQPNLSNSANPFTSPLASPSSPTTPGRTHSERPQRKRNTRQSLYLTKPGGLAGYLGTISSRRSFVDVTAKTDVYVGFLPRASIERIVEKYPIVLLTMAKRLTSLLPRLILHIDFALEWVQVDAGQAVYRQGDESDAIYIVLNGRLRSLTSGDDGKTSVIGEYGQGDSVGELEVLTESTRPGTLHAIRDTEMAKLPKTLFNSLAQENPDITLKISKIIATRMRALSDSTNPSSAVNKDRAAGVSNLATSTVNLRTVSIVPVTAGVPVVEFGSRLLSALSQIGTLNGVTSLNHAAILNHLGRHAFSRMGKLKLSQHLADLEEKYSLVLYVADTSVNAAWTQTCISQADCILLVGLADGSPSIGEYERLLLTSKTTARKELVLLHAERYCPPGLTRKWLRNRMWISGTHHHVHMSFRTAAEPVHPQTRRFGSVLKQRVQVLQQEIQKYTSRRVRQTPLYTTSADESTPFKGDFHRLARRLVGQAVGLVLGGGGARGLAHIGVIRALEEAGIPVDIVGGTSIGAFVGALYAWDADLVPLLGRAKKFAGRMGSFWRFALDLTYPSAAYTTGHEFNRGLFKTFNTAQLEDFWLQFYCNTTNISQSRGEIHTSGYAWRYVRASMSLAGLVPPLCDEGSLLLDGGYLDNLTVAHMKSLGAAAVFAVDVGAADDRAPHSYGDSLSGFTAVFTRWNPFAAAAAPPTLSEIQAKLAYVASVDSLERAKNMPGVRYLRPPVEGYGTLEFGRFDEIVQVGYEFGTAYVDGLRREGWNLPSGSSSTWSGWGRGVQRPGIVRAHTSARRSSAGLNFGGMGADAGSGDGKASDGSESGAANGVEADLNAVDMAAGDVSAKMRRMTAARRASV